VRFILHRLWVGLANIWIISVVSFVVITLPPGDFVTTYIAQLGQSGGVGSEEHVERLREEYGLDKPIYVRYWLWAQNAIEGDFGRSLDWGRSVTDLIGEYIGLTLGLSFFALVLSWAIAFPIAIYSALNRNTWADYTFSALGLTGVAVPNFLLALGALYIAFHYFNHDLGEVHSPQYIDAPFTLGKFFDLIKNLLAPALILAAANTARLIRILRANLLDEIRKPYVTTARAKGMGELHLVLKYPMRIALNPFISTIGLSLPQLISGTVIVSLVLNLPTVGPLLLRALQAQDMFLASGILMILAVMTVIGTLLSDLVLAWIDPRIRLR
jgi:peptide/nickel transport system permease protein